jgi:hypothetical protein
MRSMSDSHVCCTISRVVGYSSSVRAVDWNLLVVLA